MLQLLRSSCAASDYARINERINDMNYDEMVIFKSELKLLRNYERQRQKKLMERDRLIYQLQGVKGIDPAKEPSGAGADNRLDLIEKKDAIDAEIHRLNERIGAIREVLNEIPGYAPILIRIYADHDTIADVAEEMCYSERQFKRILDKIIMSLRPLK